MGSNGMVLQWGHSLHRDQRCQTSGREMTVTELEMRDHRTQCDITAREPPDTVEQNTRLPKCQLPTDEYSVGSPIIISNSLYYILFFNIALR